MDIHTEHYIKSLESRIEELEDEINKTYFFKNVWYFAVDERRSRKNLETGEYISKVMDTSKYFYGNALYRYGYVVSTPTGCEAGLITSDFKTKKFDTLENGMKYVESLWESNIRGRLKTFENYTRTGENHERI